MIPKLSTKDAIILALALSTLTTLYGYALYATPHILRLILH